MRIDIWRGNQDMTPLVPDLEVFALRLTEHGFHFLSDVAWTSEAETMTHFWIKYKDVCLPEGAKVKVIRMTLHEYIEAHHREVSPMNPFWAIGRHEFMTKWTAFHRRTPGFVQPQLTGGG